MYEGRKNAFQSLSTENLYKKNLSSIMMLGRWKAGSIPAASTNFRLILLEFFDLEYTM